MGLTAMTLCCLLTISASFVSSHSINPDRVKRQEDSDVNVVRYLRKYRYLTDQLDYDSEIEPDEREFNEAVRIFQNYFGLEQTGIIDDASLEVMRQSRCGCQDYFTTWMNATTRDRIRRFAQYQPVEFRARTGWNKENIRWRLLGSTRQSIPLQVVRAEIIRAFALWAEVTPLTFQEVFRREDPVDIDIDFVIRAHGDGSPFDGRGRVLAHAFFPNLGTTHFDDEEDWRVNVTEGTDLFIVAAHEFGHALGLDHTNVRGALMFPTYLGYVPNFQLHPDDIAGIQSLYGRRPTPTRPPRVTTTTTTTTPRPTIRPRPTPPPTRLPTRPPLDPSCRRRFDAAFQDDNGDLFMIRSGYIYSVPAYGSERRRATDIFYRIMYRPDAAFQIPGATFVIRRRRLQKFGRADGRLLGRRVLLADTTTALRELPRTARITAAVALTHNRIMLFGRLGRRGPGRVWDFNYNSNTLWNGVGRLMRYAFPGVPDTVDMAISRNPSEIIFVRRSEYFKYDVPTRTVEGPFDFAPAFLGDVCAPQGTPEI